MEREVLGKQADVGLGGTLFPELAPQWRWRWMVNAPAETPRTPRDRIECGRNNMYREDTPIPKIRLISAPKRASQSRFWDEQMNRAYALLGVIERSSYGCQGWVGVYC